jgi:hypothetical protein
VLADRLDRTGKGARSAFLEASSQHFICVQKVWPRTRRRTGPKGPVVGVDQDRVDGPGGIGKWKEQRLVMDEAPAWRCEFVEVIMSALRLRVAVRSATVDGRDVPCVDGSLLARVFFTLQLVGCGHVFGLLTRFT